MEIIEQKVIWDEGMKYRVEERVWQGVSNTHYLLWKATITQASKIYTCVKKCLNVAIP